MKRLSIQNILVPIDFSKLSSQAVETAKQVAFRFEARLHLVHINEANYPAGFMAPTPGLSGDVVSIQHANEKELQRRLVDFAVRLSFSPSDCHVISDAPNFDAICRFAQRVAADLIVMPTHGHTGLKHVFLGSTAERVVQHASCPVLIARHRDSGFNRILVPVDFSGSSMKALNYAISFAGRVGAKIILLHAMRPGYAYVGDARTVYDLAAFNESLRVETERQMREFIHAAKFGGVKFETAVRLGAAVEEICDFARSEDVDLIITATHGRTGFKHVLIGSVAERVVRHADRPVLVVPSHPKLRLATLKRCAHPTGIICRVRRHTPAMKPNPAHLPRHIHLGSKGVPYENNPSNRTSEIDRHAPTV
jgi:nucleotide-binding universal stress UspA family protein